MRFKIQENERWNKHQKNSQKRLNNELLKHVRKIQGIHITYAQMTIINNSFTRSIFLWNENFKKLDSLQIVQQKSRLRH